MTPLEWAALFAGVGVLLLIAEMFIPSHATLTAVAVVCFLIAVGFCFAVSPLAGFYAGTGMVIIAPVALIAALKVWPKTSLGRRMTLAHVSTSATSPAPTDTTLRVGATGSALTDLRPTGMCDFDGHRVEAVCDRGILHRGAAVTIIALREGVPVVRAI